MRPSTVSLSKWLAARYTSYLLVLAILQQCKVRSKRKYKTLRFRKTWRVPEASVDSPGFTNVPRSPSISVSLWVFQFQHLHQRQPFCNETHGCVWLLNLEKLSITNQHTKQIRLRDSFSIQPEQWGTTPKIFAVVYPLWREKRAQDNHTTEHCRWRSEFGSVWCVRASWKLTRLSCRWCCWSQKTCQHSGVQHNRWWALGPRSTTLIQSSQRL